MSAPVPIDPLDLPCYTKRQIQDAVTDTIADLLSCFPPPRPALLTGKQLARELQISERALYDLRKAGLPHVIVGESPRYELDAVLAYLRAQPKET